MPSYNSERGKFVPAHEHVVLPHLSGTANEVYDGPDRAAEEQLAIEHGVDAAGKPKQGYFGMDYKFDPDLINRARSLGYKDVAEMATAMGYNETPEKEKIDIINKEKVIVTHQEPIRKELNNKLGGGNDTTGQGQDNYGGLGNNPHNIGK